MSGGHSPTRKGTRAERALVHRLCELGLPCARVPLSGALGGAWAGDIDLELRGRIAKVQVKARRQFDTLHEWLGSNDFLILKADRCTPLVVMPLELFAELATQKGQP
jgi:hypothetical protein